MVHSLDTEPDPDLIVPIGAPTGSLNYNNSFVFRTLSSRSNVTPRRGHRGFSPARHFAERHDTPRITIDQHSLAVS
jgi:hypothetical protein